MLEREKVVRLGLRIRVWLRGLGVCVLMAACGNVVTAQVRSVAWEGDTAPDTAYPFIDFSVPVLDDNGEVAFVGSIDDGNYTAGVWSEGDGIGSMRNVVLAGDVAPGAGGSTFLDFYDSERNLYLNALGDVFFVGELDDGRMGIWSDRERPSEALTKVEVDGDPAPGTNNRDFVYGPVYNGPGNIHSGTAFYSILTLGDDSYPQSGVFNEGFSVILNKVALTAEDAPGSQQSGSLNVAQFDVLNAPTINDSGDIAFAAQTNASSGSGALGDSGVWTTSPSGTLRSVALAGESAPGTSTTFSILFRDSAVINNAGDVAFAATLNGLIGGSLREGVWVERDGSVELVTYESLPAPGTSSTFETITSDPLIDGQGLPAFVAELADGRDGLWQESSPGVLDPIAIEGDAAPDSANTYMNILNFAVNEGGQVAFKAQMSDFQDALFATDASGTLHKIAEGGDVLSTDAGDLIVEDIQFDGLNGTLSQSGNGMSSGFNINGQVAFYAYGELVDQPGTYAAGLFVSDLAMTSSSIPGDLNGDGYVGLDDLQPILDHWNQNVTVGDASMGDIAGPGGSGPDGYVGLDDLQPVLDHWNEGTLPSELPGVPEPGTVGLLGVLGVGVLGRRRMG